MTFRAFSGRGRASVQLFVRPCGVGKFTVAIVCRHAPHVTSAIVAVVCPVAAPQLGRVVPAAA